MSVNAVLWHFKAHNQIIITANETLQFLKYRIQSTIIYFYTVGAICHNEEIAVHQRQTRLTVIMPQARTKEWLMESLQMLV